MECALKSCIIRRAIRPDEWFPSADFSKKCFTHKLDALCQLANLDQEIEKDVSVFKNWGIVKDWNEEKR